MIRKQDLDLIHEVNDTMLIHQFKAPSLDSYDRFDPDGEDVDILLGLNRWGDRRFAHAA